MGKDSDHRYFIKVHVGFPEHEKTAGLSDRAFRNLIELWCYCARNLTDGSVPTAIARKILSRKSCDELTAAGYLASTSAGFEMLGYLDWQQSKAEVLDLHEKRVQAGSRGGRARASAIASATANGKQTLKQTASKLVAEQELEQELESYADDERLVSNARAFASSGHGGER